MNNQIILREDVENHAYENFYNITGVTCLNTVVNIGNFAFMNCQSLQEVSIESSTIHIGNYAFKDCQTLAKINLGNTMTLGIGAFLNCRLLKHVSIPYVQIIPKSCFESCESLEIVNVVHLERIESRAFRFTGIQTISTGNSRITYIGDEAFAYCNFLTDVYIGSSVQCLGECCFLNCTSLSRLTLYPDSSPKIKYGAFAQCRQLSKITIPVKSLSTLPRTVFQNCFKIRELNILTKNFICNDVALERFNLRDTIIQVMNYRIEYNCEKINVIGCKEIVAIVGAKILSKHMVQHIDEYIYHPLLMLVVKNLQKIAKSHLPKTCY